MNISFQKIIWAILIALAGTACSELLPSSQKSDEECDNVCTTNSMIIGCDDRVVIPDSFESTTVEPWSFTGQFHRPASSGGPFCSGSLIDNKYVLTAAHCLQNQGNTQLGFALAQTALNVNQRPFGTYGIRRVFIPKLYQDSNNETDQAYDFGLAELWEPIDGATPAEWGYVDWNILRTKPVFTAGYPGTQPDNGVLGRPWITEGSYHTDQPFGWLDEGQAGLLYTDLDGTGGQSGSPVYSLLTSSQHSGDGIIRKISGVLIGSPVAACMQDQNWVARITPGAASQIESAMNYSAGSHPFWNIIDIPTSPTTGQNETWP